MYSIHCDFYKMFFAAGNWLQYVVYYFCYNKMPLTVFILKYFRLWFLVLKKRAKNKNSFFVDSDFYKILFVTPNFL